MNSHTVPSTTISEITSKFFEHEMKIDDSSWFQLLIKCCNLIVIIRWPIGH